MSVSEQTQRRLSEWSSKLGIEYEKLLAQFNQMKVRIARLYPGKSDSFIEQRARHAIAVHYARQLRARAQAITGVFIAETAKIDTTAGLRALALDMWNNPETRNQAIAEGLVTADGVVLDTRRELAPGRRNPNYGKPLQPFWQRSVVGFFQKFGEDKTKLAFITLRGDQADLEVPLNTPVITRVNIRDETEYMMVCTSSVATQFTPTSHSFFNNWTVARTTELLDTYPEKLDPLNMEGYYDEHRSAGVVFGVVEGDLLGPEASAAAPTAAGNYRCELGDVESDIEAFPATMFVPKDMYEKEIKPLGLGSRLIVLSRFTLGVDLATGERSRVIINPIAVFVKYAVKPEESLLEFREVGA